MVWMFDGFRTETRDLWDPSRNLRGMLWRRLSVRHASASGINSLGHRAASLSQKHAQSRSVNQQSQSNCWVATWCVLATPV